MKVNIKFRVIVFAIGLIGLIGGIDDVMTGEASRKGLNANVKERPISFYLTVGRKALIGLGLMITSLSPILGSISRSEDKNEDN
ncbi:hypothetical protein EYS14_20250 [Alteromonadaceae bacterium M269]|nr:hypothetical protein EYS14_20250 [Alteromonadaceae bacterium M269]